MPTIAINHVTLRHAPFAERFAISRQVGFTGVELWIDEVREYAQAHGGRQAVVELLRQNELRLDQVLLLADALSPKQAQDRKAYREYAKQFFQDASALGGKTVLTCATFGQTDVGLAGELFGELCDLGADFGMRLALEFVGWAETIKDIPTARAIVEAANRPNGGVLYDTFHHFFGGSTMDDLRALPREQIFAVHLVDARRMELSTLEISRKHRLFPGHGSVPFAEILSILHDKRYEGFMSLEMFNEQYWQRPPLEVAREGFEAMTRLTGQAGFTMV